MNSSPPLGTFNSPTPPKEIQPSSLELLAQAVLEELRRLADIAEIEMRERLIPQRRKLHIETLLEINRPTS